MLLVVIRVLYAVVCAGAAFAIVQPTSPAPEFILSNPAVAFVAMMLASQVATLADILFPRKRIDVISAVYFGMLIGWLLSYQLYYALQAFLASVGFDPRMAPVVGVMLGVMLPYICISFLLQTKDDFRFVIPYVEFSKEIKGGRPLIVDTAPAALLLSAGVRQPLFGHSEVVLGFDNLLDQTDAVFGPKPGRHISLNLRVWN